MWILLDKIGHIHGHLLDRGVVERLNVPQGSLVILSHHVDGYSLSAKTTTPTNPVDVVFPVGRQVVVDD